MERAGGMSASTDFFLFFFKCHLLFPQAALRRKELEKSVQWAQENDKTLRQIQESLANTDRHLTAYLADHIDAQQIPQEAQVDLTVFVCCPNVKMDLKVP